MPRKYVPKAGSRKYGYSEEDLKSAISDVENGLLSIVKAANKYKIAKGTLINKLKGKHTGKVGRPLVFTIGEEKAFIDHVLVMAKWGFPCDSRDLRQLAKLYLDKSGKRVPQFGHHNLPSVEWAWRFLQRYKNELSNRMCQNIIRSKAAVTPTEMSTYFGHLQETLKEITATGESTVPPERIFNYDETNLADDPGVKKCIFKRGVKYAERVRDSSKSSTSVMYCGSATGMLLPSYVVYKSTHLWQTWMEGGPPKTRYNRSTSGWFDSIIFTDWFENLFLPETRKLPGKIVLIGDNLSSHFTPRVIELAQANNIAFVCIPPNSTHIAQPLDVAFYAPLKKYWRKILDEWKSEQKKKSQILTKEAFPKLLYTLEQKLSDESNVSVNLISGFKKCGISPFDPAAVTSRLPSNEDPAQVANLVSQAVLELLDKNRNNTADKPARKRKMVRVPAGRSITLEEMEENISLRNTTTEAASVQRETPDFGNEPSTSSTVMPSRNRVANIHSDDSDEQSTCSADIPYMESSGDEWESSDQELLNEVLK